MKVLASHEKQERKYIASCLAQCCKFTPFIVSAEGLLGCEADAVLCQLASKYTKKMTNLIQWFVVYFTIALTLLFNALIIPLAV